MTSITEQLLTRHDPTVVMRRAGMNPDEWQADLLHTRPHRALVVCSRQSGKSTCSAALALHRAYAHESQQIVCVSPTQRQSTLLVAKVRHFAEALDLDLRRDAATFLRLSNGSTIYALPGGADTVRGYSPHLLIIDEAAYTTDQLYNACTPMLAATGGDLVAITTPRGQAGWFYEEWSGRRAGGWYRVEVPYTRVSRITDEFIAGQRASMSQPRFAAEYECSFNAADVGLFQPEDVERAESPIDADDDDEHEALMRRIMHRNRTPWSSDA